jgi:hypothetical protein
LEEMANSIPGTSGMEGRPPVAMRIFSAVVVVLSSVREMVWASVSTARLWAMSAPAFFRLVT